MTKETKLNVQHLTQLVGRAGVVGHSESTMREPYFKPAPGMRVRSVDAPFKHGAVLPKPVRIYGRIIKCYSFYIKEDETGDEYQTIGSCWVPEDPANFAEWYKQQTKGNQ